MSSEALPAPPSAGRWRRRLVVAGLSVVFALVVAAGVLLWRGSQIVDALEGAVPTLTAVQQDLQEGRTEAAAARLSALQDGADRARSATSDPVWRAASHLPWVGTQLDAVTDVVTAFALVTEDVVPAITQAGQSLSVAALTPVGGRVDLAPVTSAAPLLKEASQAADLARGILVGIDTDALLDPLAERVVQAAGVVDEAAGALRVASTAAQLLPPMLGAEEERQYLVLVLNPAELRSGGGIVGAVALLTADDGTLTLTDHRAARDLPEYSAPVLELSPEEEALHSDRLGRVLQNVTMTPDFPRTAELAVEMWERATAGTVDGVLTVDPVVLSYLLEATGPVVEPTGIQLEGATVVDRLLFDAYVEHPDPDETDEYFSDVAASVFDALVAGQGGRAGLVPAVSRVIDERRMSLWSKRPEEQAVIGESVLGGAFLGGSAQESAGIFLDDATGSKLGYFLDAQFRTGSVTCAQDGGMAAATLHLDLSSTLPSEASVIAELPEYVVGFGVVDVEPGTARHNVTVYAPVGGSIGEITRDGIAIGALRATEGGRQALVLTSVLEPGQTQSYTFEVTLPAGQQTLDAWVTPALTLQGRAAPAECS